MHCPLVLFILCVPIVRTEEWLSRYMTERIHRRLDGAAAVYTMLGRPSKRLEESSMKMRRLREIVNPCTLDVEVPVHNSTIKCEDTVINTIMGFNGGDLMKTMCEWMKSEENRLGLIEKAESNQGFDIYWATERSCSCSTVCPDGAVVHKWPTCSCEDGYLEYQENVCDFQNCSWFYHKPMFKVIGGGVNGMLHGRVEVNDTSTPVSIISPYYSQITSSCTLGFFYNIEGPSGEIRIVLEWRKWEPNDSREEIVIDRITSYENGAVLDLHKVRIGFVFQQARLRIDCVNTDNNHTTRCSFANITMNDCTEGEFGESKCLGKNNPAFCSRDGHIVCLEDVMCDGINDCPNGEDEKNCPKLTIKGIKCDFNEPSTHPCAGWSEHTPPPRRAGRLFTVGTQLKNFSIIDANREIAYNRVMRTTASNASGSFLMLSPSVKLEKYEHSVEFSYESPLFPPTRQYILDSFHPDTKCTVRFRYCIQTTTNFPELILEGWLGQKELLWKATRNTVSPNGIMCKWRMASVQFPRQSLPFKLRWIAYIRAQQIRPFMAIDDFSFHPACFDPGSKATITTNFNFSTCEGTGRRIPEYDGCLRESHSRGGTEVTVNNADGVRNLTIAKDGLYWIRACGAAGGSFPESKGGKGNCVVISKYLWKGNQFSFMVGQKGESPCDSQPDSLPSYQEHMYDFVCNKTNSSLPEDDYRYSHLFLAAGGGGASVLRNDFGTVVVAGGGGGAFPNIPLMLMDPADDGFGFSFGKTDSSISSNCSKCRKATPASYFEPGNCGIKDPVTMAGGYGGGGTSCGTGGGGGGGWIGGAFGNYSSGKSGTNFVDPTYVSGYLYGETWDENDGQGIIELVICSLKCPRGTQCEFTTASSPVMECTCENDDEIMVDGECIYPPITEASEASKKGYWIILAVVIIISVLVLLVAIVALKQSKFICGRGKMYFRKSDSERVLEGVELLDVMDDEQRFAEFVKNSFMGWDSEKLINMLPQVDRKSLTMMKEIGKGQFGIVSQAVLRHRDGTTEEVAVKVLCEDAGGNPDIMRSMIMEAALMKFSNNPAGNTIQLIGVCFKDRPFIVMEYMRGGCLLNFLRASRPTELVDNPNDLTMKDLIQFAADIANGCATLERMQYLHRDLAARNCLLTSSGPDRRVKIGDFGLATELHKDGLYVSRVGKQRMIPVKWMPPEAINDSIFSNKTDVWSFGVVCWEIFSMGRRPYPDLNNRDVVQFLEHGNRLPPPAGCPSEMYMIMRDCWGTIPEGRPSFSSIRDVLENLIGEAKWKMTPIPLVPRDTVSSPIVESPGFSSVGTPCTVETTLPTPMGEVASWNNGYEGGGRFETKTPEQSETPAYETPVSFHITNDSYWLSHGIGNVAHARVKNDNHSQQQERPTVLPLVGPRYRPM